MRWRTIPWLQALVRGISKPSMRWRTEMNSEKGFINFSKPSMRWRTNKVNAFVC